MRRAADRQSSTSGPAIVVSNRRRFPCLRAELDVSGDGAERRSVPLRPGHSVPSTTIPSHPEPPRTRILLRHQGH